MLCILKDVKDGFTPYLANPARLSLASFKILSILIQIINSTKTMSELALKRIKEAKDKRLTRLDLRNNAFMRNYLNEFGFQKDKFCKIY